jgi:ligand-binding sensor domain-containing protein
MKGGKELGDFRVLDLLEDKQGQMWVVYRSAGVMVWNGFTWRDVGDLEHDQPITIFQESDGHVWIGFEHRGAARYDGKSMKNYSQNILTFDETADHRLFGGGREGLFLYNRESDQWETYPPGQ